MKIFLLLVNSFAVFKKTAQSINALIRNGKLVSGMILDLYNNFNAYE